MPLARAARCCAARLLLAVLQEAKHLIELAAPTMKRSTVVGPGGKSVEDNYRTSYGTFLRRYQDEVVKKVEHRLSVWTHLPVDNQEDMQVRCAPRL